MRGWLHSYTLTKLYPPVRLRPRRHRTIELIAARACYSCRSTRISPFVELGIPISGNAYIYHTLLCLLGDLALWLSGICELLFTKFGSRGNINSRGKVGLIACRCQPVILNSFLSTNSYISYFFSHSHFPYFLSSPRIIDKLYIMLFR